MDIVSLIIQLVLGAVGGNAGGAVVKNASLGTTGNSIVGAIGGVVLGQISRKNDGCSSRSGYRGSGGQQHGLHHYGRHRRRRRRRHPHGDRGPHQEFDEQGLIKSS